MLNFQRQQGWSLTGLLIVLLVGGFFISVAFKLAPAYADHHTLKSIMEDTIEDRALISERKHDIESSIIKRMRINNMRLAKDFMTIDKDKGTVTISVDYEVRTPLFFNVDAVMSFKEEYKGQELE